MNQSTAKVWINFQPAYELKGHQQSVLAVIAADEEQVLTGISMMNWLKHLNERGKVPRTGPSNYGRNISSCIHTQGTRMQFEGCRCSLASVLRHAQTTGKQITTLCGPSHTPSQRDSGVDIGRRLGLHAFWAHVFCLCCLYTA